MARKITGLLYKINRPFHSDIFVECEDRRDLFEYVADMIIKGYMISSVCLCCGNSTPKVRVLTDPEFKKILSERKAKHENCNSDRT